MAEEKNTSTDLSKTTEGDCPKCGLSLTFDTKDRQKGNKIICPKCNEKFGIDNAKNPKQETGTGKKNKNKTATIILFVVVLLILCGICGSFTSDNKDRETVKKTDYRKEETEKEVVKETEEERLEREAREEEARLKAEKKEEERKRIEAEEKVKEEERLRLLAIEEEKDFKATAKSVTYDNLLRNPTDYIAERVYLKGEIVQSLGSNQYHMNMTPTRWGGYTDRVWVNLFLDEDITLLEGDVVEFWGLGMPIQTYETILGGTNTIPNIWIYYANLITKAGDRN
jgi:uncharacterized Zn finger protein (UPF0148 family)